ncbi:MAG: hypothetical protein MUE96_03565 [Bacteroidia bacterium]|nr:hypothetical protein [Bacteroidia bacterium]
MNKNAFLRHIEAQTRFHTVFQIADRCGITVPQLVDVTRGAATPELELKVAKALNYRDVNWNVVRTTTNYKIVQTVFEDAKSEGMWFCISNPAGSGKTEALEDLYSNDTTGSVKMLTAEEWQDGDPLVVINGAAGYAVIDATKRLVKYVAVEEREDFVILKVAKDVGGEYVPLTAGTNQELARFISYMNKRKIPGIKTAYISQQADLIKLVASVQYAGTLIVDDVKAAVELAITNHLKNIAQFTDPRRRLNINLLRDAIEAVELLEEGSTQIGSLSVKPTGGTSVNVALDYNPVSGHYAVDPDWPLDTTITYIPV